jgi:hypothetical protein
VDWYPWIRLLHVLAGFGFVLAHGASALAAVRIRGEREPSRVAALLDLSSASLGLMYFSLLVLLAAGVTAGFVGGFWGEAWIWVAIGVLVIVTVAMYPLGSQHYAKVRRAVGQKAYGDQKDAPPPEPMDGDELAVLLASSRPFVLAAIGGIGLTIILWLMVVKPF